MDLLYRREFNFSLGLHVTISVGEREVGKGTVAQLSTAPVLTHLLPLESIVKTKMLARGGVHRAFIQLNVLQCLNLFLVQTWS